ncbi:CALCOCO1 multi-domain protein [Pyrenophora tritici-repentis]|nr:CALCOCO1 multi-domain protein [Pyrenophora tritici-repentis]KAI0589496.1 CALCOCO1 multi-domain protein [Pyrenophora tritici-repentis]KAI0614132.1 CALCOCO1 multi-domain protein [Pyrenophora tritici-repentis]KAI0626248.1 CALCOCO1 multi-domain protein [Pyrenophora tritici-repentis]PWO30618.1 hypothetical protein PtrARCrB10_00723 [Pyrenophora tritici-repentis]
MYSSETGNKSSVLEDEAMEQPGQGTMKKPVNLSIDKDIVSTEPEDWGKNTMYNEQKQRYDNSPFLTPSPHTPSPCNLHGSVHPPPNILRHASKRLAKPPTYDAPTKASEAKKNEKVELPALVKRGDSGKDRLSRPNTSDGQSPSAQSEPKSAPLSRPSSADPLTSVKFGHRDDAYTDEKTRIDIDEEQPAEKEHADPHLQDLVADIKRLQYENIALMEVQQEEEEALSRLSQLQQDKTKLVKEVRVLRETKAKTEELESEIDKLSSQLKLVTREKKKMNEELEGSRNRMEELSQERDQLLVNVQELKQQKEEYWRRDLPLNASAKEVTIADLEWNNAELRQKLRERDDEVAYLQRDKATTQKELETKQKELDEAYEYANQGQDSLEDQINENELIIQRQKDLISTLSTLMENATKSISDDSDMELSEIYDLVQQLTAQIETSSLYESIHMLFQAFGKTRRSLHSTNEDLKRQLHYMNLQVTKLEAAAKASLTAEVRIASPDIAIPSILQSPMSPLQADRDGSETLYRNEVRERKNTKAQLKQAHLEKVKLSAETTTQIEKISNLKNLLEDSQNDCANLKSRVNELQDEVQSWQSELAESKSQLELRTSAFEREAHCIRKEGLRQIKSYYKKTADESNWHVTMLQARLAALQDDHTDVLNLFNASKREKASLEEEIVRQKTFTLDPGFADHANAVREKHPGRRPLPSLSLPVNPDENGNLLPGVKAAYLEEAMEFRQKLRLKEAATDDLLGFCIKRPDMKRTEREAALMKQTGQVTTMPFSPSVSVKPPTSTSTTLSPREGTMTSFSTSRFLSPTLDFTPIPTSRRFPTTTSSTTLPTSTLSIPATSSSSVFPMTPSAYPTQESYVSAMSTQIVNKIRKRKMGKALYPPGRKEYEEVKKMTVWEMWDGPKWAQEEASAREKEILKKRGVL